MNEELKNGLMGGIPAAASGVLGMGLGMATAKWQDRRQREQAKMLQGIEMTGSKEMAKFNQMMALDMWEKTGYEAQRKQMEKAGLNVGLMYGSAGSGGTTQGATGSVSGQSAQGGSGELGMGMQLGLQATMMQAQIENMKANTEKTKVETVKTAGVDTEAVSGSIAQMAAQTKNEGLKGELMILDKELKGIEINIANRSLEDILRQIEAAANSAQAGARKLGVEADVAEAGKGNVIEQIGLETDRKKLELAAMKIGIAVDKQQIENMKAGIDKITAEIWSMSNEQRQNWIKLNQQAKELWLKERGINFATSDAAKTQQWTKVVTDVTAAAATGLQMSQGAKYGGMPTGKGGF